MVGVHKRAAARLATPPTSMLVSPDGRVVYVASTDGVVRAFSPSFVPLVSFRNHVLGISHVAVSGALPHLATALDDRTVAVALYDGEVCARLEGHTFHATSSCFSPSGHTLVSGGADEAVRVWDVAQKRCLRTVSAHSEAVSGLDVVWDGTVVASGSHDGLVRLFDAGSGQCLKTLVGEAPVGEVVFSPNGRYVLGSVPGGARLWEVHGGKVREYAVGEAQGSPLSVGWFGKALNHTQWAQASSELYARAGAASEDIAPGPPEATYLYVASDSGTVSLFDVVSAERVAVVDTGTASPVLSVASVGLLLVVGTKAGDLLSYNIA